jgi:hypothetical protein
MLKLDIDTKDPELIQQLQQAMRDCTLVLAMETRGGYHLIIERRGQGLQGLWKFAREVNRGVTAQDQWITVEDNSGPMVAIPGTNQGGFTVRLKTEEWKAALRAARDEKGVSDRIR